MLVKLYKSDGGNKFFYWEAWDNDDVYTVHWGELGNTGTCKEIKNSLLAKASKVVTKEERVMRAQGYSEIEDLKTVFIQYKINGFGNKDDLDKRYKVEELMNECLGWTGLGHCDGGDIGSGTINSFCMVVDPDTATKIIIETLKNNSLLDGAIIIEDKDEELCLLWPQDYKEQLSY